MAAQVELSGRLSVLDNHKRTSWTVVVDKTSTTPRKRYFLPGQPMDDGGEFISATARVNMVGATSGAQYVRG